MDESGRVAGCAGGRPLSRMGRAVSAVVLCSVLVLAAIPAVALAQVAGPSSCPVPAAGQVSCAALAAPGATALTGAQLAASGTAPPGYSPVQLRYAYGLEFQALTGGVGQTVAVVTAYDDATAESDMATYRSQFNLPACGTGCFTKVNETGGTSYPGAGPAGWSLATAEDLDMISAICPNCHIDLVEATTTAITDLGPAENEAVSLGADFVVNTWFTPETTYGTSEPTYDTDYFNHPGVAITAPDGNGGGYGTSYPAASPDVIAVGGTTLTQDNGVARGWTETAWSGTGSGCSPYEAKPSWQTDTGCTTRTLNDTAAVGDPNTPVAFYDTSSGDWVATGGNGAAAAIIAAAYALAGTPAAGSYPASYLYAHADPGLVNSITEGSNGICSSNYLCNAVTGYNGPAGVGTPASATALGSYAPDASLAGEPATVDPVTGSLDVFGTGTANGTVWGDFWTPSGGWAGWKNMGGILDAKPISALYDPASGNIEVYALAPDSDVYEDYSSNGTTWSPWQNLGGDFEAAPSAVFNPLTGTVDVWEIGTTGTSYVDSWHPATGWSGWQNKGGVFSASGLTAAYDPVNLTMDVFGAGNANGTVWGASYTSATGSLSAWVNMGGNLTGVLSAIYDPTNGYMEVYGQDTSDYTEETQRSDPGSGWAAWHYLKSDGPVLTHPPFAVYNPLNNSIEVWAAGNDGTAWDDSWTTSGGWTAWVNRSGDIISAIDPVFDPNSGDLRTFGVGSANGTVWGATMNPALTFSSWANLSGGLQSGDF
jgi:hypothetical protein